MTRTIPEQKLRQSKMNWRIIGALFAPIQLNGLTGKQLAQSCANRRANWRAIDKCFPVEGAV